MPNAEVDICTCLYIHPNKSKLRSNILGISISITLTVPNVQSSKTVRKTHFDPVGIHQVEVSVTNYTTYKINSNNDFKDNTSFSITIHSFLSFTTLEVDIMLKKRLFWFPITLYTIFRNSAPKGFGYLKKATSLLPSCKNFNVLFV